MTRRHAVRMVAAVVVTAAACVEVLHAQTAGAGAGAGAARTSNDVESNGVVRNDTVGDARRGEALVRDRSVGMCLLCHSGPFPDERFQGNLAPPLDGAGARHTPAELRVRIEDSRRISPATIMPAYARTGGFERVGTAWEGKPILDARQIEDVVAFLATLR